MAGDPLLGPILLQIVMIIINAFFAMTEIASISVNDNKLMKMAENGDKKAQTLSKLLKNPSGFLSTIQIGITLAGFLSSAFAAENFASRLTAWFISKGSTINPSTLQTASIVVITMILSYFMLVFGELVPKRLGQRYAEPIALGVARIILVLSYITKPIVWLLTVSTNGVLRLLRIDPNDTNDDVTEEEIRMLIDVGGEKGTIHESEREMIDNVFEFNDRTAEELMTHRTDMVAISLQDDPAEIRSTLQQSRYSRFPVYDEDIDDIVGVLNIRDYLLACLDCDGTDVDLSTLIRPAYFVPDTVSADVLFKDMQQGNIHMALVVDEYGGTHGLVTIEDLIEEIVGNIYDEYDELEDTLIQQLGENKYRLSGSVSIEDLSDLFKVELPDEEFDTLGGLIFAQLSTIPNDDSQPYVEAYGLNIQVEKIEDRRIVWAVVEKLAPAPEVVADKADKQDSEETE